MTLAVFLEALRLLASTLPLGNVGLHSLEGPRFSEVGHLLRQPDFSFVSVAVLAAGTNALRPTDGSSGEALAVELEAAYLRALAPASTGVDVLPLRVGFQELCRFGLFGSGLGVLLYESFEKVELLPFGQLFDLHEGDFGVLFEGELLSSDRVNSGHLRGCCFHV